MNNQSYPWYLSWPAIIVAFLLFWPVAIVLIYLRTKNSKSGAFAAASNKKVYMILGAVLVVMGIGNIGDSFLMGLFFIAGGAALIYYSNTLAKKAVRNKQYIDMIVNQGETSVDKIASVLNIKYDVALSELKTMQTLGILKGATINEQTHSISVEKLKNTAGEISGMVNSVTDALMGAASTDAASEQTAQVTQACPGCGAKYTGTAGTAITGDYCDSSFVLR